MTETTTNAAPAQPAAADQPVPFLDLQAQTDEVAPEVRERWDEILRTSAFVLGPAVDRFERELAEHTGARHAVGVGNGTDALEIALQAAGIGPGDEVIVPANTFFATAEAVLRCGATLVPVDVDDDYLIDPQDVAAHLTPRTRAVVAVHLYGQMAPVARLREVVGPDVLLVEDAAQSQGASRDGLRSGGAGDVAATSFYPGKNLGAFGDGGAVLTSRDDVALRARRLRNHGGVGRYEHLEVGTNSRLDALQAAALSVKLTRLDGWNALRSAAAGRYAALLAEAFADVPEVVVPREVPGAVHVWHLYVVRVPGRAAVSEALSAAGIGHGIHYPAPVHLLPATAHLGLGPGTAPRAEAHAGEILSLPMFPGITAAQQERVVGALHAAVRTARAGAPGGRDRAVVG
ncbi:DegT/DnrJ/EryC1/StrS family aminotransferase [Promicromonospora thailandica]|uniref:dTDP-4-amino-4,6-dideoxygalactose transaminase n=1 Tax=Promicromonospora thailandica TaxID=765201 RepID=A0A9X2JVW2_9MICO|nr:DegT/DnrJ/EryC1/StrS family aminotransferase [Promicromonospora thailandica]MCP2264902.1 dTDP-4-amino-4,6-dideoxygalactose transaminase [Promicromonospora thailandica]BFF18828.1 DegT/DnrJ/EryC1/StrS family aminotransferase [Promicromonospora thailandica]